MKIIFNKVKKSYNKKLILKNISFEIEGDESIGLMGESGCGKSTLARILMGMEEFDEGDIFIGDVSYKKLKKGQKKEIYENIQLVFQNSQEAVNPNFSVEDVLLESLNIFYGSTLSKKKKVNMLKESLELVGLQDINRKLRAHSLSGGQLQRLCIARALILKPKRIILDESLSGLDPTVQKHIIDMLKDIRKKTDTTYLVIAHDYTICHYLCDKVWIMEDGVIAKVVNVKE